MNFNACSKPCRLVTVGQKETNNKLLLFVSSFRGGGRGEGEAEKDFFYLKEIKEEINRKQKNPPPPQKKKKKKRKKREDITNDDNIS